MRMLSIMLEEVSSTVRFCARTRLLSFSREWPRQLRVSGCLDGGSFHVFGSNRNHINLSLFRYLVPTIADGEHLQRTNSSTFFLLLKYSPYFQYRYLGFHLINLFYLILKSSLSLVKSSFSLIRRIWNKRLIEICDYIN